MKDLLTKDLFMGDLPANASIIDGNTFWPEPIIRGLTKRRYHQMLYDVYQDIPKNLYQVLCQKAYECPHRSILTDDSGISYTYAQLLEHTDAFAAILSSRFQVTRGTHVGLLLYTSAEFCIAFLAMQKLRAVVFPFPTKYRKEEIFSLIRKSDLSGIICEPEFLSWFPTDFGGSCFFQTFPEIAAAAYTASGKGTPDVSSSADISEDTAAIIFTSGTTSQSKGVIITNYNMMHAITVYQRILGITPQDRTIIPIPIYHVTGLIALFGLFLQAGGHIYLHKFFHAQRILSDINTFHITFLHAPPTVFSLLLEHADEYPSLPSIRALACGSSNMPKKKLLELARWMPDMTFHTVYGLTETASPATVFPGNAAASSYIGSSGCPIPGTQFKICDESGTILPIGKTGTIFIRGTNVLPRYYHLNTPALRDGWLDTGDLGYFNEDGYLYITDRKKDMINRGGEKVCSFDVENALYEIEGIREAAVVGIPDPVYGEVPAAMISLKSGVRIKTEQIQTVLKEKLANYQIPVKILQTAELPQTPNSKIDKRQIKAILSQEAIVSHH